MPAFAGDVSARPVVSKSKLVVRSNPRKIAGFFGASNLFFKMKGSKVREAMVNLSIKSNAIGKAVRAVFALR
jgi:hypothetical protein